MRQTLFILALLLFSCFAFGQKHSYKPRAITLEDQRLAKIYGRCFHRNKYTSQQRLKNFPFNGADTIKLVSYEAMQPNYEVIPVAHPMDTVEIFIPMAVNHFVINHHRIKEVKVLSPAAIDSLTDILYNTGFASQKVYNYPVTEYNCYEPRNAILFIDKNGRLTSYIEFCFECQRYYYSSSTTKSIDYCEQKYSILRSFFFRQGLNYGTIVPNQDGWVPPTM
jgi:hypothetical protein